MAQYNEISEHIHVFHFEDIIYDYERSIERVQQILGLTREQHVRQRESFDPEKSIHNTQLFRSGRYQKEMKIIEDELSEYLYDFPYEIDVELGKVF